MGANAEEPFGDRLRRLRRAAGLTQGELAERAGVSLRAISDLERGQRSHPWRDTVRLLADALDLAPADRAALEGAARGTGQPAAAGAPLPARSRATARHNLPVEVTSFVGRERELADVKERLAASHLLTLTGSGGCGKTRLALRVAAEVLDAYPDGIWLVELAPLSDPTLVPQAVALALDVREVPGRPLPATLAEHLEGRAILVVLDNCEHVLDACARIAEALLRACPRLRLLATSRERLGIGGEVVARVTPLTLPEPGHASLAELARSEAVRLFVERAEAVRPGFALTEGNAAAVAEICRRLDGIPLALELAAARAAVLSPEQIARHLGDRFRLLTTGSRTALPRHQTLRALVDWCHALLSDKERILFRRLAVFAGGWTLAAAEAVAGIGRDEVLDLLMGLVDQSLVLVEERGDEARYRLLETLRDYAREKLDASGETCAVRAAHAAYYAAWTGGPGPSAVELPIKRAFALPPATVAGEADNLRAALDYFLDQGEAEAGLGLAARIYHLWFLRGPREEGRAWLRRLLARPTPVLAPSRAAALFAAGWLARFQGDLAEAGAVFAEAATLAGARGDHQGRACAQTQLGVVAFMRGELAQARTELEEGARLVREADAPAALLQSLVRLGHLAVAQGDLMGARAALVEGRTVLTRLPAPGFMFNWLAAELALAEGDGERAAREYRAALADRWAVGDGDAFGVAVPALGLAEVAAVVGQGVRAARLLGGSEGLALGVGNQAITEPAQRTQHARVEAATRELLGDAAFAALRAEGRRLGLEEVVRLALGEGVEG